MKTRLAIRERTGTAQYFCLASNRAEDSSFEAHLMPKDTVLCAFLAVRFACQSGMPISGVELAGVP